MTRFDDHFQQALSDLSQKGLRRITQIMQPQQEPMVIRMIDNRLLCDFSSNDYLGLSHHPLLKERAQIWTEQVGVGARASRLVSGSLIFHQQVEEKVARFKRKEAALLFPSGWQANASVLPALFRLSQEQTGHKALVFTDRLNHASLHHGCAAAGAGQIRFRHNDLVHLTALLEKYQSEKGLRFIITESVFSMDGDQANIIGLRKIADQFNAFLYLDEAHATGILGVEGRGLSADQLGADLVMGTFSKALGCFGAYIAGSRAVCDWLINSCSGFIYSTALPPSMLGAMDAALDIVPTMDVERHRLLEKATWLRQQLQQVGLDTGLSSTPIIPIIIGDNSKTLQAAKFLEENDILTIAIRPPTVPSHSSRLRIALTAIHDDRMLEQLCSSLVKLASFLTRQV
ncbi:MAG: aminotransferase class I/II-fold pyridoxal phosphate-dependent enzyme [Zymomonas mobilis subsp. pomaceae]|uniref:aminotransferase class I/II-fold pyridoxal phosphate-dependent enzyme n=1 Tax=Zymomonas mobilis TaxID=542 RepID=UPI0039EAA334